MIRNDLPLSSYAGKEVVFNDGKRGSINKLGIIVKIETVEKQDNFIIYIKGSKLDREYLALLNNNDDVCFAKELTPDIKKRK